MLKKLQAALPCASCARYVTTKLLTLAPLLGLTCVSMYAVRLSSLQLFAAQRTGNAANSTDKLTRAPICMLTQLQAA
jgi:hypothetical protein